MKVVKLVSSRREQGQGIRLNEQSTLVVNMDRLLASQLDQAPAQVLDSFTVNRRTWHRLDADWRKAAKSWPALRIAQLVPFGRNDDHLESAATNGFSQRYLLLLWTPPSVNQNNQRCQIFPLAQIVEQKLGDSGRVCPAHLRVTEAGQIHQR